jgi:hypothetical protein
MNLLHFIANKQRKPVRPIKEMNEKHQSNSKRKLEKKSCHYSTEMEKGNQTAKGQY